MKKIETKHYIRISKHQARKIYDNNGELYIIPCKMNPENPWGMLMGPVNTFYSFDTMVNSATYYNCGSGMGNYLAFYIKKGD